MILGLKGNGLPESQSDAEALHEMAGLKFPRCVLCSVELHLPIAASTPAGWRETQISGVCEPCFDDLFAGDDDEA